MAPSARRRHHFDGKLKRYVDVNAVNFVSAVDGDFCCRSRFALSMSRDKTRRLRNAVNFVKFRYSFCEGSCVEGDTRRCTVSIALREQKLHHCSAVSTACSAVSTACSAVTTACWSAVSTAFTVNSSFSSFQRFPTACQLQRFPPLQYY